uniref:Phenylalanine ammonia-lyase 1 n=1 Tax=Zeugodacus cucurbitae TaxID=28588 RepID=A0A0A1XPN8_ZEUCU
MTTKRGRGEGDVKRKMARLRFKNLIRSVTLNRIWLMDSGEQKLSLNVKKNINMLIRPQRKVGILTMAVTTKPGGKSFELFDISANEDDNLFQDSVLNISKDGIFRNKSSFFDVNYEIMSEEDDKNKKGSRLFQKMDLKSIEASCGLKGISEEEITSGKDSRFSKEYLNESEDEEYCSQFTDYPNTQRISVENMHGYLLSSGSNIDKQRISNIKNKENIPPSDEWRSREDYFNGPNSNIELGGISSTKKECNTKIENHFIDVGSITFGGIFSLGEKLEHRVIMARTTVQCLMLPRYWLMERDQNPGNIWQRRRFYLDSTIPSREQLFKDFLTTRTWQKFKNSIISSNFTRYLGNPTKVQDIPIICRIVEPSED